MYAFGTFQFFFLKLNNSKIRAGFFPIITLNDHTDKLYN
jgi:hypothetical protein